MYFTVYHETVNQYTQKVHRRCWCCIHCSQFWKGWQRGKNVDGIKQEGEDEGREGDKVPYW